MKIRTIALLTAPLLIATTRAARATGYYLFTEKSSPFGNFVVGYAGFSTTDTIAIGSPLLNPAIGVQTFTTLYDFNGDGVPEIVLASSASSIVDVLDFNTGTVLDSFNLGINASDGTKSFSISGSTVTVTAATDVSPFTEQESFTYDPPGDPILNNSIFDLDGDGIADQVAFNTPDIVLTNGATNATTSFFPFETVPVVSESFTTWSPGISLAPEPASLALLSVVTIPLLRRRKRNP